MGDITTITVKKETWRRLLKYKKDPSLTWDAVINMVLDRLEKSEK